MSEQCCGLEGCNREISPADESAVKALAEEYAFVHAEEPPDLGSQSDCPVGRMRALRNKIHELKSPRTALCLSGGGIRSATFSLGVLQALAAGNLLNRFNYLSTVSGGGYIGSWLSSWIAREQPDTAPPGTGLGRVVTQLAKPQARRKADPGAVRRLRAYSNYLSPVWGASLDFITLIATFLRNLFLNWTVLVPALMALLLIPWVNISRLMQPTTSPWAIGTVFTIACLLIVMAIAYVASDMPHKEEHKPKRSLFVPACLAPFIAACVMLTWVWAWLAAVAPATRGQYFGSLFAWLNGIWPFSESHYWHLALLGAVIHGAGCIAGAFWRSRRARPKSLSTESPSTKGASSLAASIVAGFIVAIAGAIASCAVLAAGRQFFPLDGPLNQPLLATVGVPLLLCCIWLGANIYAALTRLVSTEGDREWWGRASAWFLYAILGWIVLHVLVIYLPKLAFELYAARPLAVKSSGLLGIVAGIVGFWNKSGLGRLAEKARGIRRMLGDKLLEAISLAFIVVLLGGLAVLNSAALDRYVSQDWRYAATAAVTPMAETANETKANAEATQRERVRYAQSLANHYTSVFPSIPWYVALGTLVMLVGIAMLMSSIIGPNTFSMQAMYGNRLVRAYLGATRNDRDPHPFNGFDAADNIAMSKVGQRGGLFHVVNVALNMVTPSGGRLEWQQRKAASFTISPLHSGSAHLGYRDSKEYANGISLGRAMTLSGAAASPNMGYHSSGLVTFVMAFFNVRLGGWLPNPGPAGEAHWRQSDPNQRGPGVVNEALGRTTDNQPFVYLSDGGHFENLGLYEMVYRRCNDIVVVDASCDPDYEYEDLESAIRKVRTDLGITIEFKEPLPSPANLKHYVTGTIHYKEVDGDGARDGRIIYIKPLLTGDEPLDVRRYANLHAKEGDKFPHQSTADQFFDEAQFESYRELGRHSGTMLVSIVPTLGHWPPPPVVLPPSPTPQSDAAPLEAPSDREMPIVEPPSRASVPSSSPALVDAAIDTASRNVFSLDGLSIGTALMIASMFLGSGVVEGDLPEKNIVQEASATDSGAGSTPTPAPTSPPPDAAGPGAAGSGGSGDGAGANGPSPASEQERAGQRAQAGSDPGSGPGRGSVIGDETGPRPGADTPNREVLSDGDDSTIARANTPNRLVLPLFVEASNCPIDSNECRNGTSPEAYSRRHLRNLAEALLGCTAGSHRVAVRIEGFASSSTVRTRSDVDSANVNLWVAQQRAKVVSKMLEQEMAAHASKQALPVNRSLVGIQVEDWNNDPKRMRESAGFVDNAGGYRSSRGWLNRRVDVVLSELGACAPNESAAIGSTAALRASARASSPPMPIVQRVPDPRSAGP